MDSIMQIFLLCITLACTVSSEKGSASTTGVTTPTVPHKQPRKPREVCYDHVGCFSLAPPFSDPKFKLPKSPELIGTTFKLFTRSDIGSNDTVFLNYTDITTLRNSRFNPSLKTKFVVHGFSNDIKTEWPYGIKNELLKQHKRTEYCFFDESNSVDPDQMPRRRRGGWYGSTVFFKALTAHILMMPPNKVVSPQNQTPGLDPAEPNYKDHPIATRLDKNDAAFVDVIHTNGAPFSIIDGYGLFDPCGDVDFYVNGGKTQIGCSKGGASFSLSSLFGGKVDETMDTLSCSHGRAHEVFAESINSDCPFTAYPCSDFVKFQNGDCLSCGEEGCGTMGYYADQYSATGMMFLNTRSSKPFCGHHYAMKARVSAQSTNTQGSLKVQLNGTWGISEWVNITKSTSDTLQTGKYVNSVVVTKGIIGRVKTVNVKYTKSGSGAKQQIRLEQISILNGEKRHQKYLLCFTNSPLSSGVSYTYPVSEREDCVDKA